MIDLNTEKNQYFKWPVIDIKLKNSGEGVGLLTKAKLNVLSVKPISKTELYYQLITNEDGDLIFRIINLGWGKATNVTIEFFNGKIREYLDLSLDDYTWQGNIDDYIELIIPARTIKSKDYIEFCENEIVGISSYIDNDGVVCKEEICFDGPARYPATIWSLILSDKKFSIRVHRPTMLFSLLIPSAKYDVILPYDKKQYIKEVSLSQSIEPNHADRFQIVIGSERPAEFVINCELLVDGNKWIDIGNVTVRIDYNRYLTSYGYREGMPINIEEANFLNIAKKA